MRKILFIFISLFVSIETLASQAILNQSAAAYVRVGPVYYNPTGSALVADTTSDITAWTCRLTKGIGTSGQSTATISLTASGGNNDCTHDGEGLWKLELTTGNTDTTGGLEIAISYSGRLPCVNYYDVVAANGYADHYTGTTGTLSTIAGYTDTVEGSLATIAGNVDQVEGYTDSVEGTLATIAGYTDTLESVHSTITGYIDTEITTLLGYTDSVEGTLTTISGYVDILPQDANAYGTTAVIADAVWDENITGHLTASTGGKYLTDILEDTGTTLDTKINTVDDYIDTEIATLLGYTDSVEGTLTTISGYTDTVESTLTTINTSTGTTIPVEMRARIASATATIVSVSEMLAASGIIPPASGMTRPAMYAWREGSGVKYVVFEGLSASNEKPNVSFSLYNANSASTLRATAASLSYYPNTTEEGLYRHVFTYLVPDTLEDGDYGGLFSSKNNGQWAVTPFTLVLSPTPTVNTTGIVTESWMAANMIHPASQAIGAILSGMGNNYQIYRTKFEIPRTIAGLNSPANLYAATDAIIGASISYVDYFSGLTRQKNIIFGGDEYDRNLSSNWDIGDATIPQYFSDVFDVTEITTAGGL